MRRLTGSSCHVNYVFQSETTLCRCLNIKEILAQKRLDIGSLSDYKWARTHSNLVRKQTLNHLAKQAK